MLEWFLNIQYLVMRFVVAMCCTAGLYVHNMFYTVQNMSYYVRSMWRIKISMCCVLVGKVFRCCKPFNKQSIFFPIYVGFIDIGLLDESFALGASYTPSSLSSLSMSYVAQATLNHLYGLLDTYVEHTALNATIFGRT